MQYAIIHSSKNEFFSLKIAGRIEWTIRTVYNISYTSSGIHLVKRKKMVTLHKICTIIMFFMTHDLYQKVCTN